MKTLMGTTVCAMAMVLWCGTAVRAEEPSMKKGFEEVGDAIKDDSKAAVHDTDEEMKEGLHATERGVGDALQKSGEGMDHAGEKVHKEAE